MSTRHRQTTAPQPQRRYSYLFGSDRETALPRRSAFCAGGAGGVAC